MDDSVNCGLLVTLVSHGEGGLRMGGGGRIHWIVA